MFPELPGTRPTWPFDRVSHDQLLDIPPGHGLRTWPGYTSGTHHEDAGTALSAVPASFVVRAASTALRVRSALDFIRWV